MARGCRDGDAVRGHAEGMQKGHSLTVQPLPGWVHYREVIARAAPDYQVEGAPLLYLGEEACGELQMPHNVGMPWDSGMGAWTWGLYCVGGDVHVSG